MAALLATTTAPMAFPPMITPDLAADRLRLAQLLSPAFPIGTFAHSQGLESAIAEGLVPDGASLANWIGLVLSHGSGRMDATFLALARQGKVPLKDLTDLFHAMTATAERAQESRELGAGFTSLLSAIGAIQPPLPYAIAVGHATRDLALPAAEVIGLFLQSLASQLISVAVRFLPMGQSQGQHILAALTPQIARIAGSLATATTSDLYSFTPGAEMASMRHETQDVRIFRT